MTFRQQKTGLSLLQVFDKQGGASVGVVRSTDCRRGGGVAILRETVDLSSNQPCLLGQELL